MIFSSVKSQNQVQEIFSSTERLENRTLLWIWELKYDKSVQKYVCSPTCSKNVGLSYNWIWTLLVRLTYQLFQWMLESACQS